MAVWSVRGYGRLPKAPQIVPQYLIPLGEHLELVIPQADIQSEAMDEHQGMSCTSQLIIEPSPVHVGKACMYGHGISPPGAFGVRGVYCMPSVEAKPLMVLLDALGETVPSIRGPRQAPPRYPSANVPNEVTSWSERSR